MITQDALPRDAVDCQELFHTVLAEILRLYAEHEQEATEAVESDAA